MSNMMTPTCWLIFMLFISSCTVNTSSNSLRVYNDDFNEQFWSADWSPDGRYIAVAGVDSTLRIYNAKNLTLYKAFTIPNWIHVVAWNPSGSLIALATLSQYVLLLDVHTGHLTPLYHKNDSVSTGVANGSRAIGWNAEGNLLAVGDLEGDIQLWDSEGKLVSAIDHVYGKETVGSGYLSLAWHPYKNIFLATNYQINLIDSSGRTIDSMQHKNPAAIILCAAWHPSGDYFVIGDYGYTGGGEEVPSLLHFWSKDGAYIKNVRGSHGEYRNLAWTKNGEMLATASDVLRIWDENGSLLHEGQADSSNFLWGVDWNPNGTKIATASRHKTISIWNKSAELIRRLDVL